MGDKFFEESRTMGKHEHTNRVSDLSYNPLQEKLSMHFKARWDLKQPEAFEPCQEELKSTEHLEAASC